MGQMSTTKPEVKKSTKPSIKKQKTTYGPYIARIQKRADSKTRLSLKALQTIDSMVSHLVQDVSSIIGELNRKTKNKTMAVNDVKAALKLVCGDGELSKHCIMEGSKAVMKFQKK